MFMANLNAQNFIGDWKGQLSFQGMQLEIILHISEKDNQFTTTLDVPMQGAVGIPLDKTAVEGNLITTSSATIGINFKGELNGENIEGTFSQAGMDLPLILSKFESKLPGDMTLPSNEKELLALRQLDKGNYKYKVSDYFAKPKASGFQLSPNGQYLSYREKDDKNKRHIYVKNIKTGETKRAIEEKEELVRGYGWINSERLYYAMDKGGDENYHIYGVNLDGSNLKDLTPFDGVTASISNILKEQKDFVIITMNKNR
jgi:hypothetical protein